MSNLRNKFNSLSRLIYSTEAPDGMGPSSSYSAASIIQ